MNNTIEQLVECEIELVKLQRKHRELKMQVIEECIHNGRADMFSLNMTKIYREAGYHSKRDAINNS